MAENRKSSTLEQIEQEFEASKEQMGTRTKKKIRKATVKKQPSNKQHLNKKQEQKKKQNQKKRRPVFMGGMILATIVIAFAVVTVWAMTKKHSTDKNVDIRTKYPTFLTAEEQKEWKEKSVDKGQIYVYVNTHLEVKIDAETGTKSVALRLANPPYSAYPLSILLSIDEQSEVILYQSELLMPGDSVDEIALTGLPEEGGTYMVTIFYTFYEEDGETIMGEHQVKAELHLPLEKSEQTTEVKETGET